MRKLIQLIPEDCRRALEGATRMLKAVSFMSDATLDAMVFASRFLSSAAAARRTIWLRAWPTTYQDKAIVTSCPFQGDKLFGEALERILIETTDKKKAMPQSLRRGNKRPFWHQGFRSQHTLSHFQQDNKRQSWSAGKQSFRKPFFHSRFSKPNSGRADGGDRDPKPTKM